MPKHLLFAFFLYLFFFYLCCVVYYNFLIDQNDVLCIRYPYLCESDPVFDKKKSFIDSKSLQNDGDGNVIIAGSISYANRGGLNNQRESLFIAWILAYLTNLNLILRPIGPSSHDSALHYFEEVFQIKRGYVDVSLKFPDDWSPEMVDIKSLPGTVKGVKQHRWTASTPQESSSVQIKVNHGGFIHEVFPFLRNDATLLTKLLDTITYSDEILAIAEAIQETLGSYNCVHFRVGDKEKYVHPLTDCLNCSYNEAYDILIGNEDRNRTIYIATADKSNKQVRKFIRKSPGRVSFWTDVAPKGKEMLGKNIIGAVEQIVCSLSEIYLPSFPSGWDEYVIMLRKHFAKDSEENFQRFFRFLDQKRKGKLSKVIDKPR